MTSAAQRVSPVTWLGWDGARLRWRIDANFVPTDIVELRLDGIVFARFPAARPEYECEFAYAPGGNAEMEFSLHAGDVAIGAPWRVILGRAAAAAGMDQWAGDARAMRPLPGAALPPASQHMPPIAIVVPIYNSPDLVRRCIDALLRWTSADAKLILIDDASTDSSIAPLLATYTAHGSVRAYRNPQNLGYTRSCNLGIAFAGADADVVLLNSDTEVGPRWLERLRLVAYADATIGTVTAVSDNAGAFSVPELEQYCPIPERWTLVQAQRALLQHAGGCLPELPTGNGFCMYIKRTLLDRVGVLDAEAFPAGYGEENDLCQRAERAGYRHLITGDVLVRHARSASFGVERRATLGARGMAVLRERYPDYEAKVGATLFSFARRVLDYRVRRIYADTDGFYRGHAPLPRLLVAAQSPDLGAAMSSRFEAFECFALAQGALFICGRSGPRLIEPSAGDQEVLAGWLARYAIEFVYAPDAGADLRGAASRAAVPLLASAEECLRRGRVALDGGVP